MYPILGRYGSFFLYSYTVLLGIGIGLSLLWTRWRLGKRPFLFDLFLWCGGTAVLLGRIGFVLVEWAYFSERPQESWQLWQGGLAYQGVLFGGLLGLWLWQQRQQQLHLAEFLTAFAPALALLHLFGWAACLLEGCAYGQPTTLSILAADLPDTFGVYALRYQTQLLGIIASLIILLVAWWKPSFWLILALLGLLHFSLTFLRGDPAIPIGHWRLDTLLSLATTLIALFLLQYNMKNQKTE